MTPEQAPAITKEAESLDYIYWWLSPILLLIIGAFSWANHFDAGFHRDDFPNIVNNRNIRLGEVKALVTSPRAFSAETELADFRPLLGPMFASEYALRPDGTPYLFQMISFLWFLPLPFMIYLVARIIPEAKHRTALYTAGLFAVHPIVSDTLNYVSRRGELIAAAAVSAALLIWAIFPERLPRTLGFNLHRIPKTFKEELIFKYGARIDKLYQFTLGAPTGFYFVPLVIGLLCSPAATAFVGIAAAWAWVYPPKRGWGKLLPAGVVCGLWLVLHTVLTWKYLAPLRVPALEYWLGQPFVAIHYLSWYFTPFRMSADAGLVPSGLEIAFGFAAVAALVFAAIQARRRTEWKPVALGIAWFLGAQVPMALVPQTTMDSAARMFIPAIGLALALGHTLMWVADQAPRRYGTPAAVACSAALLILLGVTGWETRERNRIWESDKVMWYDTVQRSPGNGRALIQLAWVMIRDEDMTSAAEYVNRAEKVISPDATTELLLAQALDRLGRDDAAEKHFTNAIARWPRYSAPMSKYAAWLFSHQRSAEAADWSRKAIQLNFLDNNARHTLMDVHSAVYEWPEVRRLATEAKTVDPEDGLADTALVTSQDAMDRVRRAEHLIPGEASSNDYLSLSVSYYRAKRYEDAIRASRQALQLQPDLAEAYANMAAAQHALGQDDEAASALREVIRLRPDFAFARTNLQILEDAKAGKGAPKK